MAGVTIQQSSGGVIEFYEPEHTSKMGMDDASIREHEEVTKVKVRICTCCSFRTLIQFKLEDILLILGILARFQRKCILPVIQIVYVFSLYTTDT